MHDNHLVPTEMKQERRVHSDSAILLSIDAEKRLNLNAMHNLILRQTEPESQQAQVRSCMHAESH
jgi:hypothetical protein